MQSFFKNLFDSFSSGTTDLISSPYTLMALGVIFILIVLIISFKRVKLSTRTLTFTAIIIAITFILNLITIFKMPQGGSITLGSMVPILLLSLYYGPELGFLAGFIFGIINLLNGGYILHPVQVLFDYPLPFMMLGFAGFFKVNSSDTMSLSSLPTPGVIITYHKKVILGVTIAVLARLFCHWISGFVFFGDYAPEGMHPAVYSLIYNGSFLLVEYIITLVLLLLVPFKRIMKSTGL